MNHSLTNSRSSALLVVLISLLLTNCQRKPAEVLVAEYLVSGRLTTGVDSAVVLGLANQLCTRTPWQNNIQVNQRYRPDKVNIYLIDGHFAYIRDDEELRPLLNNCAYAGSHVIFIDDAYLRGFLDHHHVERDQPEEGFKDDQACFLYWVIGHELGHLACGHLRGDFDAGSLDHFVKTSSLANQQELQADSFFVQAIAVDSNLVIAEERLMISILNAEIEQKVGVVRTVGVGIIYDYTDSQVVRYARQPSHPEYVIRLSRMLELSARLHKDSGLYNLVGDFIRHMKGDQSP